jgi:hypothetical protein
VAQSSEMSPSATSPEGVDTSQGVQAVSKSSSPQDATCSAGSSLPGNDKAISAAAAAAILAAASTSFSAPRSPALTKALENAARHKPLPPQQV